MNAATFAQNVHYWNTQIPTLHDWLKTLSPTYSYILSVEDCVFVYHVLRLLFNFRNPSCAGALLVKLKDSLISDIGPSASFDLDERARSENALHYTALLAAYRACFYSILRKEFKMASENEQCFKEFMTWGHQWTGGLTMLCDLDDHKSFVTLVAFFTNRTLRHKFDLRLLVDRKCTTEGFLSTRQWGVVDTAHRAAGATFQNTPKCVNLCLKDQIKRSPPENIFSPRPRSIKNLRKEERKKIQEEKKIPNRNLPFRMIEHGEYESDPGLDYKVCRKPLKRTNAMIEEQWEAELTKPNPKKLKTDSDVDFTCDEVLTPTPPHQPKSSSWVCDDHFTPCDLFDAEDCNPGITKKDAYELAAKVYEAKESIDANYIRKSDASRCVIRKTLNTGERLFVFIKTEQGKFDEELADAMNEFIKNYIKKKALPLNQTQVIKLKDMSDQ